MNTHLKHLQHNSHGNASGSKTPSSTPSAPPRECIGPQNDGRKDQRNTEHKPRGMDEERRKQKKRNRAIKVNDGDMDSRQEYNENCQLNWYAEK